MAKFSEMPLHYQRIHRAVAQRLWTDLTDRQRFIIANDVNHVTEEFNWYANKVEKDALRLFEDPTWHGNAEFTFRIPKHESSLAM